MFTYRINSGLTQNLRVQCCSIEYFIYNDIFLVIYYIDIRKKLCKANYQCTFRSKITRFTEYSNYIFKNISKRLI